MSRIHFLLAWNARQKRASSAVFESSKANGLTISQGEGGIARDVVVVVERRGAVVYALLSRESFEKTSREMCVCVYIYRERKREGWRKVLKP